MGILNWYLPSFSLIDQNGIPLFSFVEDKL